MTQDYEFILLKMGYKPLKVVKAAGRFYEGQHVWGKYIARQKQWEIVNEMGLYIGSLPYYAAKRREIL